MEKIEHQFQGLDDWPDVTLTYEEIGGRFELTKVEIEAKRQPPAPLSATVIRRIRWAPLIAAGLRGYEKDLKVLLGQSYPDTPHGRAVAELKAALADREGLTKKAERQLEALRASQTPGGRRPQHGPERWAEVASVYSDAWRKGLPPTSAVAEHFHVSKSLAAKWVHRARGLGLLPKTTKGKAKG